MDFKLYLSIISETVHAKIETVAINKKLLRIRIENVSLIRLAMYKRVFTKQPLNGFREGEGHEGDGKTQQVFRYVSLCKGMVPKVFFSQFCIVLGIFLEQRL